jgi:hypothetical protein
MGTEEAAGVMHPLWCPGPGKVPARGHNPCPPTLLYCTINFLLRFRVQGPGSSPGSGLRAQRSSVQPFNVHAVDNLFFYLCAS